MEDAIGPDGRPQGPKPVASRILVASLFRRAHAADADCSAKRPSTPESASPEVAYPSATNEPPYPPQALSGGVVLVEVTR